MHPAILINEFLPDPVGADKGWEWIELVNVSEEEVNLSNWEIQVAGVKYNRAFKFPTDSKILPGQYLLICEEFVENCHYYTTQLAIQNGGKETDGVRILNENLQIIDTVLYDTTNSNNLLNDFGEIEKDENIVEMPPAGCSLSRKSFSDTNFSKKDFYITCTPTPGKENKFQSNIVISEVGHDFIEFYSIHIPGDLEKWYVKEDSTKFFLQNDFKNNFFSLKTTKPLKNIELYNSEDISIDSFFAKNLTTNYTLCRLNSDVKEEFTFCEKTEGEKNALKQWKPFKILEVLQIGKNDPYIIESCVMYEYEETFVISDESAALGVNCNSCEIGQCFLGEVFDLNSFEVFEKVEKEKIAVEKVNSENYVSLFNKIVFLEAKLLKTNEDYSFFETELGLVKLPQGNYANNINYNFKGILGKDENLVLELTYPVIVKQEQQEYIPTLEQTGDPLIFLSFFFLIPFLLSKIFVKLLTIKF